MQAFGVLTSPRSSLCLFKLLLPLYLLGNVSQGKTQPLKTERRKKSPVEPPTQEQKKQVLLIFFPCEHRCKSYLIGLSKSVAKFTQG